MAQKSNRLLIYGGLLVVAVAGFMLTEPEKTTSSSSDSPQTSRRAPASTKKDDTARFTEEDEEARFARLQEGASNVFKPVVVESGNSRGGTLDIPNAIPAAFMGGEAGWFLTGIVTFDGRTVALLENTATNEGQYLGIGESLRQATLTGITRNTITLAGSNGQTKQFTLLENRPIVDETNYNASNNAPFDPLVGAIGINKSAETEAAADNRNGTE